MLEELEQELWTELQTTSYPWPGPCMQGASVSERFLMQKIAELMLTTRAQAERIARLEGPDTVDESIRAQRNMIAATYFRAGSCLVFAEYATEILEQCPSSFVNSMCSYYAAEHWTLVELAKAMEAAL